MTMNVIDVSRYQAGEDIGHTGANAVIIGLTYGSIGVNPYAADEIARARHAGMLTGLYHIRAGDGPTPAAEAQHFLDNATQYLDGKTVIFLDWEECTLSDVPWALAWCTYIFNKTGIRPVIYMSASVSLAYDWSSVRAYNIGLWVAQYPYNVVNGFLGVNWTPPATSWGTLVGWQYGGTGGSVGGIDGLDLSVFYLTPAQWIAYATPATNPPTGGLTVADINSLTAQLTTLTAQLNAIQAKLATVPTDVLGTPMPRAGGKTGITNLGQTVAWLDANLSAIPAAVLNQTFTTAAGVKTNVPGLLDAINTKPAAVLTADQIVALAAQLGPANIKALAAQFNK